MLVALASICPDCSPLHGDVHRVAWDVGFLALGVLQMIVGGLMLRRPGERRVGGPAAQAAPAT